MEKRVNAIAEKGSDSPPATSEIGTSQLEAKSTTPEEKTAEISPSESEEEAAGFQGDDKEEYVKGDPVIRNGELGSD